jgi:hypothetical protein
MASADDEINATESFDDTDTSASATAPQDNDSTEDPMCIQREESNRSPRTWGLVHVCIVVGLAIGVALFAYRHRLVDEPSLLTSRTMLGRFKHKGVYACV